MNILFDQGVPVPLRRRLVDHSVSTAFELGWSALSNGELLDAAENENFDALVTTDRDLKSQQKSLNKIDRDHRAPLDVMVEHSAAHRGHRRGNRTHHARRLHRNGHLTCPMTARQRLGRGGAIGSAGGAKISAGGRIRINGGPLRAGYAHAADSAILLPHALSELRP